MRVIVCAAETDPSCAVCNDAGEWGRILELCPDGTALVELCGGPVEVAMDLLPDARVGERVVVHLGFALSRVNDPSPGA
ncbi:MAG: HypC/HybG/HupF family hydrogenase formation chaperone [Armatimonadetes bacterium]|nr:HypC/HybG/HupF family hydrogenase formation chaperone [Armatimonadota bacterium]